MDLLSEVAFISLGCNCQVAHQLRELTVNRLPGPFDWAVSPYSALIHTIDYDFEGMFDRNSLSIIEGGKAILDQKSGLKFYHAIPPPATGGLTERAIDSGYRDARLNWLRKVSSWRTALTSAFLIFVRLREDQEAEDPYEIYDTLFMRYPHGNFGLLALNHDVRSLSNRRIIFDTVLTVGPAGAEWKGNADSWKNAIDTAQALFYDFR